MGDFKIKLIFLLIVYFAGFATAIYMLAPVPEGRGVEGVEGEKSFAFSALKTNEFAASFNSGMHKSIDFTKDATIQISKLLKQKIDERESE